MGNNTTIEIDRKTHAKIKQIQISKEKEHERPVSIKEIVRESINFFIASHQILEVEGN